MESYEQNKALMKANCWNTSVNPKMHKQKKRKLPIHDEQYNFSIDRKGVYVDDNFVFPSGYRFCPHDQELIVYYLKKKIMNEVLPHNKIKEVNLYRHTPEELSENYAVLGDNEWYFFTPRDRKYPNGDRPNRAAGTGYWKATGADKPIMHNNITVGFRKALVFHQGKPPNGNKTNWIMHEFRVNELPRPKAHASDMKLDDWVLCRIYKRYNKSKDKEEHKQQDANKNNSPLPTMVDKSEKEEFMDNSCVEFAKQQFGADDLNFVFDFSKYNPDYFPYYGAEINIQSSFPPPATLLLLSDPRGLYEENNIQSSFSPPATSLSDPRGLCEESNIQLSFSPPATSLSDPRGLCEESNIQSSFSPPATSLSDPRGLCEESNIQSSFSPPATSLSDPRGLCEESNIQSSFSPPATSLSDPRGLYEESNIQSSFSPPATSLFPPYEENNVQSSYSPPATLLSYPRGLYEESNIQSSFSPLATLLLDPRGLYEESNIQSSFSPPAISLFPPYEENNVQSSFSPPATLLSVPVGLDEESNIQLSVSPPTTDPDKFPHDSSPATDPDEFPDELDEEYNIFPINLDYSPENSS